MPHIRFRGVLDSTVSKISQNAIQLAKVVETDVQNFTFEKIPTQFYENGAASLGYPFVEVFWFPRSQEKKQVTAKYLTQQIQSLEAHEYITVIFHELSKDSYFENYLG